MPFLTFEKQMLWLLSHLPSASCDLPPPMHPSWCGQLTWVTRLFHLMYLSEEITLRLSIPWLHCSLTPKSLLCPHSLLLLVPMTPNDWSGLTASICISLVESCFSVTTAYCSGKNTLHLTRRARVSMCQNPRSPNSQPSFPYQHFLGFSCPSPPLPLCVCVYDLTLLSF